jgi:16S rRNA (cytosine1402-N4)-methyltransferase
MQLDQGEKGFSFLREGPLDMRMDRECSLTAEEIVNTWSEDQLGWIFKEYGDLPKSKQLAKKIGEFRKKRSIKTTSDLKEALTHVLESNKRSLPPLTLVFQALRIAVNNELEVLQSAIPQAIACLASRGRLGIISFHSGEDRIVKNCFRDASTQTRSNSGELHLPITTLLTKKPITPSRKECRDNSRSRSAKMRFLEKN